MQAINTMVEQLRATLSDTHTPQLEALDAMRYVLQLQADQVASALDIEPFALYTHARVSHHLQLPYNNHGDIQVRGLLWVMQYVNA